MEKTDNEINVKMAGVKEALRTINVLQDANNDTSTLMSGITSLRKPGVEEVGTAVYMQAGDSPQQVTLQLPEKVQAMLAKVKQQSLSS